MSPINLDADPRNSDWMRTLHWDLPEEPEKFITLVLGSPADRVELVRRWLHFQALPAFEAMPEELRREVDRLLGEDPSPGE